MYPSSTFTRRKDVQVSRDTNHLPPISRRLEELLKLNKYSFPLVPARGDRGNIRRELASQVLSTNTLCIQQRPHSTSTQVPKNCNEPRRGTAFLFQEAPSNFCQANRKWAPLRQSPHLGDNSLQRLQYYLNVIRPS